MRHIDTIYLSISGSSLKLNLLMEGREQPIPTDLLHLFGCTSQSGKKRKVATRNVNERRSDMKSWILNRSMGFLLATAYFYMAFALTVL